MGFQWCCIYATITKPNFTGGYQLSIINMSIYFCYYLIQKIKNKELTANNLVMASVRFNNFYIIINIFPNNN